jgi:hypothetical protein
MRGFEDGFSRIVACLFDPESLEIYARVLEHSGIFSSGERGRPVTLRNVERSGGSGAVEGREPRSLPGLAGSGIVPRVTRTLFPPR